MELVQNMENADDRDAEQYTSRLEKLLEIKDAAIQHLFNEVSAFQRVKLDISSSPKMSRK